MQPSEFCKKAGQQIHTNPTFSNLVSCHFYCSRGRRIHLLRWLLLRSRSSSFRVVTFIKAAAARRQSGKKTCFQYLFTGITTRVARKTATNTTVAHKSNQFLVINIENGWKISLKPKHLNEGPVGRKTGAMQTQYGSKLVVKIVKTQKHIIWIPIYENNTSWTDLIQFNISTYIININFSNT